MYSFSGPAEVRGFYQKIRTVLQTILIVIFVSAPWIYINGKPMILLDIFSRHFVFFGFTFFSHDAPLLFFLLILLILAIFIVTALFGRLWCGWSCPQTVFINALFNRVEKIILGNYSQRHLFFKSEDSLFKKIRICAVYLVFLIFCWILAHSFAAYFVGSEIVTRYIFEGPRAHLQPFLILVILTGTLFFNFVFFREKLCFLICPYGKFQNALIDSNSLVVFYDLVRGEPRGKLSIKSIEKGDCVACNRCISVCPTKIDIREGFQFECIACGKCIDACNEVMHKLKRQPSLIRYETGDQKKIDFKRFRLALYGLLLVVFSVGFVWILGHRNPVEFAVTRAHANPFSVRYQDAGRFFTNQIVLHLINQTDDPVRITLKLSPKNSADGYSLSTPAAELELQPQQDIKIPGFVEIAENRYSSQNDQINLVLENSKNSLSKSIQFVRIQ